ncbi:MAG: DUF3795 domain-containing protein [Bacteroidales bacterium]|nr:DUF3795 domain-containing protein [Bacteroidales bacterium]
MNFQPEDITDCDGCRANMGRFFSGCLNCKIWKCASEKNIDSCAFCNNYVCETFEKYFSLDPSARIRLKEIQQNEK